MILRSIFDDKKEGFYVDVGAFHPKLYSNTYYFYKRGWRGINIEPNPGANFGIRKGDINLKCGIGLRQRKYQQFKDGALNKFGEIGKDVEIRKLDDVLQEHKVKKIDFLSVDTEGMDLEVLQSNNWEKYRPEVVLVEEEKAGKFLEKRGYELVGKTPLTRIYKSHF